MRRWLRIHNVCTSLRSRGGQSRGCCIKRLHFCYVSTHTGTGKVATTRALAPTPYMCMYTYVVHARDTSNAGSWLVFQDKEGSCVPPGASPGGTATCAPAAALQLGRTAPHRTPHHKRQAHIGNPLATPLPVAPATANATKDAPVVVRHGAARHGTARRGTARHGERARITYIQ